MRRTERKPGEFRKGDFVILNDENVHIRCPDYYPPKGSLGNVVDVEDKREGTYKVVWITGNVIPLVTTCYGKWLLLKNKEL